MSRKKPDPRLILHRGSDNDKRRLQEPAPDERLLFDLADRATYEAYSKHKLNPHAYGLPTFIGRREDATYCDGHSKFSPEDMSRIPTLLRRGILAGLVGENRDFAGDPTMLWTVDDNGWIYEARITTPGRALYHGFPVLRTEAIARLIIARFVNYVYNQRGTDLHSTVQNVQKRYS